MARAGRSNVKAKPNVYPRKQGTPPANDTEFRTQIRGGEGVALLIYALTKTYPRSVEQYSFLTHDQKEDFENRYIRAIGNRPKAWVQDRDGRLVWGLAPPRTAVVSMSTGQTAQGSTDGDWYLDADGRLAWGRPGPDEKLVTPDDGERDS